MKYSFLLSGLIFAFTFAGCTKNKEDDFVVPPGYKAYLSHFQGSYTQCLYEYTDNKVNRIDQGGYNILFTDTTVTQLDALTNSTKTTYKYWIDRDASGKPITGRRTTSTGTESTRGSNSFTSWDSIVYKYTNDQISSVIFLSPSLDTTGIYKLEYVNGNLTRMMEETRGLLKKTVLYEMTYSTEKGPFYDAVIPYVSVPDQLTKGYPVMIAYSKNPVMSIRTTAVSDGGKVTLWTYEYKFNKYKYPEKLTAVNGSSADFTYK